MHGWLVVQFTFWWLVCFRARTRLFVTCFCGWPLWFAQCLRPFAGHDMHAPAFPQGEWYAIASRWSGPSLRGGFGLLAFTGCRRRGGSLGP
jgi:hypothetical protein